MDLGSLLAALGSRNQSPLDPTGSGMPSAPGPGPFPPPGGVSSQGPFPGTMPPNIIPPGFGQDPALGLTMIQNPEAIAGHMAANGIPPPADQPEGVGPDDASQSLGKALTSPTPSQQGADETVPLPRPRPTPAAETANDTGAAVPAPATPVGDSGVSGQSVAPKKAESSSAVDDLGKALAGLKPIPPPAPPVIRTPEAYRPTNQISRSSLPTALLQSLSNITKGTTGPYRLGQALKGIRAE